MVLGSKVKNEFSIKSAVLKCGVHKYNYAEEAVIELVRRVVALNPTRAICQEPLVVLCKPVR